VNVIARRAAPHLAAGLCLLAAALVYCAPLLARLTTGFPGTSNDRDVVALIWNVGWIARAAGGEAAWWRSDAVFAPCCAGRTAVTCSCITSC
jgi:hypothetical protein